MKFAFQEYSVGAGEYLKHGNPLPAEALEACANADAMLLGAMGLPSVRWPDGKEMTPQLDLREKFQLYCGLRPIRLYHEHDTPLEALEQPARLISSSFAKARKGCSPRALSQTDPAKGEVCDVLRITRTGRGAGLSRRLPTRDETPQALHAGGQGQRAAVDGVLSVGVRCCREGVSRCEGRPRLRGRRRALPRAAARTRSTCSSRRTCSATS